MAKKSGIGKRVAFGSVISSDFFARHWLPTVIFVVVMMIYITTKFTYRTNIEKITALEQRLEIVENEKDRERSSFMSRTRETAMQQMVDSLDLGLRVQPQPPYKIR
ncbi:MAG: FtsL-like putative cell division protein [Muribaculaceae bacterium]|nr:FtsL-like putative cell division protein [Muribaculaceae bacterium]